MRIPLLITFVFAANLMFGQAPHIETLKIFKNRKDVEVTAIYQDSKGYIWVAANSGLVRYNGVEFLNLSDSVEANVSCMISDTDGQLWFGHKNGSISIFDGKKFSLFDPEEGLGTDEVSSFYIDNNGVLWFTTLGEGAYYYRGENRMRLYNLNTDDGLLDSYVYQVVQDSNDLYYFGTDKGISIYDMQNKAFVGKITMTDGLPDNIVKQLEIRGDELWIGMEDAGLSIYNIKEKRFKQTLEWEFGSINNFEVISENEVWISTKRKGVIKCLRTTEQVIYSSLKKDNGLADTRTTTVFADKESNLWIGTQKGLSIRRNNYIEFLGKEEGFEVQQVFSMTTDLKQKLWVASQSGLFCISKNTRGQIVTHKLFTEPEFEFATFISVYTDRFGNIWAGTYGMGAYRINAETFEYESFNTGNGLSNDNVIHITGFNNEVWFSTLGGGVSILNLVQNKITNLTMNNGLPVDYIYSAFVQDSNLAWLATDGGGVVKLENKQVVPFKSALLDSIGKVVYSVAGNKHGILWFNIPDHGLIRYWNDDCRHITEMNNLISNSIQSLVINNNDELIVTSNLGIGFLDCANLEERNIGEEDGLAYLEPNLNAVHKDDLGNIYIGHENGLVKLLAHSHDSEVLPNLYITRIRLFDETIDARQNKFKYNDNYLTFNYNGLLYSSSQAINYRYILEGYDIEWRDETTQRSFTYSNLPPGDYTFKVEMKLPNGDWHSSTDASYVFKIRPPFWQTKVFIAFSIVFIGLLVLAFIRWRTHKLEEDKRILEDEVFKRTAEIRHQKDEIEAQRDEIEAQRNYVTTQRDKIEHQNKEITASIQYASRIQKAVLPPKANFEKQFNDYFLFFKPRDIVSGDFYYLNFVHGKTIVAAADCTGHGVPGAFVSMLGVSLLNQIVGQLNTEFNASDILTELRAQVKQSLRQTGQRDEAKDGMDISLCVLDKEKMLVHFAGAFNPLFMVRNGEPVEYKGDKMPIGVHIVEEDTFTNHEIEIQTNDMLFMYSDGFQDQFGGEQLRKFLPKRLRQLLLNNASKDTQEQHNALVEAFDAWKANENQVDDVLVIGVRI